MPTSQTGSYIDHNYDTNVPDMVLLEITYRCQRPRRGLTREHI
ncbi:hypothetical protein F383_04878 [Gossypium arboreum]|uniref:Uncharacterized protein n=1 Tax=Gossypium arboreum TaxID=29729 RepID=A0A0B0PH20_GOSAR|nr:hypothetical protein F383_04878 [Gossypium arboreum]